MKGKKRQYNPILEKNGFLSTCTSVSSRVCVCVCLSIHVSCICITYIHTCVNIQGIVKAHYFGEELDGRN